MSIKVGGNIVIDNDENFNLGISTVGYGNSSITINSSVFSGIGITADISTGNINSSVGILTAAGISFPLGLG